MSVPSKILVFGAGSSIASETLKLFAGNGASLFLFGRNEEELKLQADDLKVRGAVDVQYGLFDALDDASINSAIDDAILKLLDIDGLFVAYGTLPDQKLCETSLEEMNKAIKINFTSTAAILTRVANHFEKQGRGSIAVISSVAGDRGRQSNYVYGSAKGALTVFLAGLRHRLSKSGVNVLTIKPGFVDTPMTADYKKGLLFVKPDVVAKGIFDAIKKGKKTSYLPWFWWWVMFIIRNIPEMIFNRTKL